MESKKELNIECIVNNVSDEGVKKKKLLIVEDKPKFALSAYRVAIEKGYGADVAFNLSQAKFLLDKEHYAGIITDMCFQENGISIETDIFDRYDDDVKPNFESVSKLCASYALAVNQSVIERDYNTGNSYFRGATSDILRSEVINASEALDLEKVVGCYNHVFEALGKSGGFRSLELRRDLIALNSKDTGLVRSASNPAIGYHVIKEAQEKGIPVVVATSLGHASHALPALIATGLVSTNEIESATNNVEVKYEYVGDRKYAIFPKYIDAGKAMIGFDKNDSLYAKCIQRIEEL